MKVLFMPHSGRSRRMSVRFANVLHKLGRGTYMTRDMAADESTDEVDLDAMDIEALRDLAKSRGISVHHRAGREKLLAALRGA